MFVRECWNKLPQQRKNTKWRIKEGEGLWRGNS